MIAKYIAPTETSGLHNKKEMKNTKNKKKQKEREKKKMKMKKEGKIDKRDEGGGEGDKRRISKRSIKRWRS